MFLNREELRELIEDQNLFEDYIDLETQLTPNGFDVTAGEIHEVHGRGQLDFSNSEREIPGSEPVEPEYPDVDAEYGWWELPQGMYKIVMNEKVNIPNDLVGVAFPRSSLLRMGAHIQNAGWDAGYSGHGEFLLVVENPSGIRIKENARVNQLMFAKMDETDDGYDGIYKA